MLIFNTRVLKIINVLISKFYLLVLFISFIYLLMILLQNFSFFYNSKFHAFACMHTCFGLSYAIRLKYLLNTSIL
jgi:hypothetical protein